MIAAAVTTGGAVKSATWRCSKCGAENRTAAISGPVTCGTCGFSTSIVCIPT